MAVGEHVIKHLHEAAGMMRDEDLVAALQRMRTPGGSAERIRDLRRAFGLSPDARRHLFRVDGSKSNYAPLTEVEWFERLACALDNGDHVASPRPWTPPVDAVTLDARAAIELGIGASSAVGPWFPKLSADARSIRNLLTHQGVSTSAGQRQLLKELRVAGYCAASFRRENREPALGYRAPDGRPNTVNWL